MNSGKKIVALNLMEEFKNLLDENERMVGRLLEEVSESEEEASSSELDDELALLSLVPPDRRKLVRIQNYVESVVAEYDEQQFQGNFRLTREAFEIILRDVTEVWKEEQLGRKQIKIDKQLLAVIWLLATPDSYRSVSERFDLTKSSLSMCFVRVVNALNKIASKHIKWPSGEELAATKSKFASKSSFRDLIGVIDGTYVQIKVPKSQCRAYTNRKNFTSMTLQCVCDSEMKYLDCYTGWPSSVPDIRVFKNSDLFIDVQQNEWDYFPNGEYILGDKAYPCLSWCIPPYMRRQNLTIQQTIFNKNHASARVIVENSFALLFGRFRRLRNLDMNRLDWVPSTILACCVLHNVCLNFNEQRRAEYIEEGRATVNMVSFEQDPDDVEDGVMDGISKRNMLCRQMMM